jgi:hypothetical protein
VLKKIFTFIFVILGLGIALVCIIGIFGYYYAQGWLDTQGIKDVTFEISDYSSETLELDSLSLTLDKPDFQLRGDVLGAKIKFHASPLELDDLKISAARIHIETEDSSQKRQDGSDLHDLDSLIPAPSIAVDSLKIKINDLPLISMGFQLSKNEVGLSAEITQLSVEKFSQELALQLDVKDRYASKSQADFEIYLHSALWGKGIVNYDLPTLEGDAQFRIPKKELSNLINVSGQKLPKGISIVSGKLGAEGKARFDAPKGLRIEANVEASSISVKYNDILVSGVSTNILANYTRQVMLKNQPVIKIDSIDFGLVLKDISTNLNSRVIDRKNEFELLSSKASLLGGLLFIPRVQVSGDKAFSEFLLIGKGISTQQIVKLYKSDMIKMSGDIQFSAPLSKKAVGALVCEKGEFWSQKGGHIALDDSSVKRGLGASHPLYEVSGILSDFNYSELKGAFDYSEDGTLILNAQLKGRNPSYQNGREVHLNLTLEENIPKLLASIRLKDDIEQSISNSIIGRRKK